MRGNDPGGRRKGRTRFLKDWLRRALAQYPDAAAVLREWYVDRCFDEEDCCRGWIMRLKGT
jgi:hypothetical protein